MSNDIDIPARTVAAEPEWFGQPRGLSILFLTEMWTTFSFFGMRALLVLYATKQLHFGQQTVSWIYGIYAAGVYLTPIFGGIVTDRWLGPRLSVLIGGSIMAIGHFMMGLESLFFFALATIALGNGLFLPGLPSQIDSLYAHDDPRRKSAYNIYYVGINIGAFASPIVVGTVGELYGFHWGFSIAGFGMLVAIVTYVLGGRYLPSDRSRASPVTRARRDAPQSRPEGLMKRFGLLFAIAAVVVIFRGAYEQIGNTMALWADANIDRSVTSTLSIPVTWFQSLNSMVVILLSPVLVAHWTRLAKLHRDRSSVAKMAIGAAVIGFSYLAIAGAAHWADGHSEKLSWIWLAGFVTVMTAGELYILPVGLGLFGRLAPAGFTATTIAIWFSAGFLGNLWAGWLGTLWTPLSHGIFFAVIGAVALFAAVLLLLLVSRARLREAGV